MKVQKVRIINTVMLIEDKDPRIRRKE